MARRINEIITHNRIIIKFINYAFNLIFMLIRFITRKRQIRSGNVVIIALHKLGDTVFTIPSIIELQKQIQKRIIIVCFPDSVPIYNLALSDVDFCILGYKHFYFSNRFATGKARAKLNSVSPEIIYDLTGVVTSASLIFNSRATEIIGMNSEIFKSIYDRYSSVREKPHLVDMYLDAICSSDEVKDKYQIRGFALKLSSNEKVLIHPGAGWEAKKWGQKKFIDLAIKLNDEYDISLIAKINEFNPEVINEMNGKGMQVLQTGSINDLIHTIEDSSVVIGNDSGPVYIASLLGKATYTIFGPTNPAFSASIGEHHTYITKNVKCSPSGSNQYCFTNAGRKGCPAFQCMNLLEVDEVYNNIITFLEATGINKSLKLN